MKSMKKLVLVGLVLLASVIVLVGCDTNAGDTQKSANKAENLTLTIEDANGNSMSVTLEDTDSDGYYEIGTADKLYAFAAAVNGGKTTINGELTANIVVNEKVLDEQGKLSENVRPWTPIGNGDTPYTGTFDGAGCTISGLSFNDTKADYAGLFGFLGEGGSVQNLGVLDSYFCGGKYVGGIVGVNYGAISNCYNTGDVSGTVTGEISYCSVGGVVGSNSGGVTTCYNTGDVSGKGTYCYVGGVVGGNSSEVTTCYSKGDISGTATYCYVGGVVGRNFSTISNCYNEGAVSGTATGETASSYVGGVVGENEGEVSNCYNEGAVSGTATYCSVGGVVGSNSGQVTTCYNEGAVSGTAMHCSVGGVVGSNSGEVTTCYYLSGKATGGINGKDDSGQAEAMDESFFEGEKMAEILNANQEDGPWKYINENSAPTLKAFNKG